MKSIIIVSTLLFVTASFMGIGNYTRYNQSLRERGLYAADTDRAPKPEITDRDLLELQLPQQTASDQTTANTSQKDALIEKPAIAEKKRIKKSKPHHQTATPETDDEDYEELHSGKNIKEREIRFKHFSRAPLDDEAEPVSSSEDILESEPALTSKNEEKE